MKLTVSEEDALSRLDLFLAESDEMPDLSRSYIQKLIKGGNVLVNHEMARNSRKVMIGDEVEIDIPEPEPLHIEPENIPLDILYEDDDLLVVNKPKGMVVHPAPGHPQGTLVNALLYHCRGSLSGINGIGRPGIVHRIDKDTTGSLVVAKNDRTHAGLAAQLAEHSIKRIYNAIVWDNIREDNGTVNAPIGRHPADRKKMAMNVKNGREAVTHYHVLERFGKYTYIECTLETGRTHQIRVHMTGIGHPLLGDAVYGARKGCEHFEGQTLHARVLGFVHPTTGEYMEFEAQLPPYFQKLLTLLRDDPDHSF